MFSAVVLVSSLHLMDLTCQIGCGARPSKALALKICNENLISSPGASGALQSYHCTGGPDLEYLMNHMCLCDKDQDAPGHQGAVCSNNCNGYGCCHRGQVCMSSKILNSDYNRCFDYTNEVKQEL